MPVYTTAELDKLGGELAIEGVEKVEHTILSGMEADIIMYQEAPKYEPNQNIYLFEPTEGYVIQIVASYSVPSEELLKFADSLSIERVGDTTFETKEENFFDFTRFDGWLNEDKTLKSYQRQCYDTDGELIAEDEAEQEILSGLDGYIYLK